MKAIVSCSFRKNALIHQIPTPAGLVYDGTLIKTVMGLCEELSIDLYILSAKYGLIKPDTKILPYDEKMTKESTLTKDTRDFIEGNSGIYFGSESTYFREMPDTWKPAVNKKLGYTKMNGLLFRLMEDPGRIPTLTWFLYYHLLRDWWTLEGLITLYYETFPNVRLREKTVATQVRQIRLGNEKGICIKKRTGSNGKTEFTATYGYSSYGVANGGLELPDYMIDCGVSSALINIPSKRLAQL